LFSADLTGSLLQLAHAAESSQPQPESFAQPSLDVPAWPWSDPTGALTAAGQGCQSPFSFDAIDWTQIDSLDHTL